MGGNRKIILLLVMFIYKPYISKVGVNHLLILAFGTYVYFRRKSGLGPRFLKYEVMSEICNPSGEK